MKCNNGTSNPDKVLPLLQTKRQVGLRHHSVREFLVVLPEVALEVLWLSDKKLTSKALKIKQNEIPCKSTEKKDRKTRARRENNCVLPKIYIFFMKVMFHL